MADIWEVGIGAVLRAIVNTLFRINEKSVLAYRIIIIFIIYLLSISIST
jgi:hypothetical protein